MQLILLLLLIFFNNRLCLHTVFFGLIERELAQFMEHWNSHTIRASRNGECLGGRPDDLYDMPSHYGMKLQLLLK